MSVGADIQFRIWSPVMSVVAVQDLNASTRLTAHNAMMQNLSKKTLREIQTERIKLGEHLGVRNITFCFLNYVIFFKINLFCLCDADGHE